MLNSMLDTVGLELSSFVNSDLSWKFSKGSRSSSRRARKIISTSLKTVGDKDSNCVEMPISESEKLGVSVLGCRFSAKAENVPIKKRKFLFRSPSPPPRAPSPHPEETKRLSKIKSITVDCSISSNDLDQIVDTLQNDEKNVGQVHGQFDENEDFSGISILAAAACSNSIGGVDDHTEEGSGGVSMNNESCSLSKEAPRQGLSSAEISAEGAGSCVSAVPAEELTACPRKGNCSIDGLQQGYNVEETSLKDRSVNRWSHWDLNTEMDAWDNPFSSHHADSQTTIAYELKRDPADNNSNCEKELLPSDLKGVAYETVSSKALEHKSDGSSHTDRACCLQEKFPFEVGFHFKLDSHREEGSAVAFVTADNDIGSTLSINIDRSTSDQCATVGSLGSGETNLVALLDSSASGPFLTKLYNNSSIHKSEGNCEVESADIGTVKNGDVCASVASEIFPSTFQAEKQEVVPYLRSPGNKACETGDVQIENVEDAKEISSSFDCTNTSDNMVQLESVQSQKKKPLDDVLENPVCHEVELRISDSFVGHLSDTMVLHDKSPMLDDVKTHILVHNDIEDPSTRSSDKFVACRNNADDDVVNTPDKMAVENPFNNGSNSDVSHDCANVKISEPEVDYDSQYEDGEVRESIIHTWEEYDGEDVEADHVDYGSDNANNLGSEADQIVKDTREMNFSSTVSSSSRTKVVHVGSGEGRVLEREDTSNEAVASDGANVENLTSDVEIGAEGDFINEASQSDDLKMKMPGWEQVLESRRNSSNTVAAVGDFGRWKNINGGFMDDLYAESTDTRTTEFRRRFHSRMEGRASRDLYLTKDKPCFLGSSDTESLGRARSSQHAYARGEGGDHWSDSPDCQRCLKRQYSPNDGCPPYFRRHGPENSVSRMQIMDAYSHSLHRGFRSRSPIDRDQAFILRMGFRSARERSPGRRVTLGQGRSVRYGPQVDGIGPRRRYHGPLPNDCTESSLKKRERSFSPFKRRDFSYRHGSNRKSPMRSKTHSPSVGKPCPRGRSKSPSFKSEARVRRVRSPHTQPSFVADHIVGFRSMTRSHFSPPQPKWVDDNRVVNFREQGYNRRSSGVERRSPGRFNARDGRFDLMDSPRIYRSMHSGRISEVDGVGRGRLRYEGGNDDCGKNGPRNGLLHPTRRYEMEAAVKRFRYNVEDGFFGARNSRFRDADFHDRGNPAYFNRSIESQIGDVPSRFREVRTPFINRRDQKQNVDPKSLGARESEDVIASRRRLL